MPVRWCETMMQRLGQKPGVPGAIAGDAHMSLLTRVGATVTSFAKKEDGASLAEYLVLMGVIVAAVIGAISFFGTEIATAFSSWGSWIADNSGPDGCNQGNDKEVGNAC